MLTVSPTGLPSITPSRYTVQARYGMSAGSGVGGTASSLNGRLGKTGSKYIEEQEDADGYDGRVGMGDGSGADGVGGMAPIKEITVKLKSPYKPLTMDTYHIEHEDFC